MISLKVSKWQKVFAPEVLQTSVMDCGPAALKCVLEGFGIPVSYGRLREVCQTSIDGTSIETIEQVANQLGLNAEQILIPIDHIFIDEAKALPAIIVVKRADGATHFVVVWSKLGRWLQVMDPAVGRRWLSIDDFQSEIYLHQMSVSSQDWFQWAKTEEYIQPLKIRLSEIGVSNTKTLSLIQESIATETWLKIASLDASIRFVSHLVNAGGVQVGDEAARLLTNLLNRLSNGDRSIHEVIPAVYWTLGPPHNVSFNQLSELDLLKLQGAVLVRVTKKTDDVSSEHSDIEPISEELGKVLKEPVPNPMTTIWRLLKEDGILAPLALSLAMVLAASIVLIQMLLFKGLFDISASLNSPVQRLIAVALLLLFLMILLAIEIPIAMESMRMGRHLEIRLRLALLEKLPKLSDRYFQSRPISDMAERSHSIYISRLVPGLGLHLIQAVCSIFFTLIGIILIDPLTIYADICIILVAGLTTFAIQPALNERDLRVRSHVGAMNSFYLDALIGAVPIATHQAQKVVMRQHEGLLVSWARSSLGLVKISLFVNATQSLLCLSIAAYLIYTHFLRISGVNGSDLLLVFWVLRLPAIAREFTMLAHQYPAQRNMLLRLIEPLTTPVENESKNINIKAERQLALSDENYMANKRGEVKEQELPSTQAVVGNSMSIDIQDGLVVAAGHTILAGINLSIKSGEHIAIVGTSGAGKSTILGLLLGWHKLSQGTICVDGLHLNAEFLDSTRTFTAWVDPSIQLWNRSFLKNITYSTEHPENQSIHQAISEANLKNVLERLPEGMQTYLGEGGSLLSGGEGQRVRLARALMQTNVKLVLLDEPFRGLDRDQRSELLRSLREWWSDATLICVTHDLSETLGFNRVLVVESGEIVEDDSPTVLLNKNSRYHELFDAESFVREQIWKSSDWRKISIQGGRLSETTNALIKPNYLDNTYGSE
jgi:ATP-binding cassette subfamily B protein